MLGQGKNIQPYISSVIENCLITGAARTIRKLAYIITRQAATLYELPWSTVTSSVSQDLGTVSDPEFQVYALRMLYILPLEDAISTFLAQESVIMAEIHGKNNEFTQIGFLTSLPGVLIRMWCGLGGENFQLQDAIKETFKFILAFLTDSDDKLCCLAFAALGSLFQESEEGKLRGLSQELEANGSDFELLSPLISYLCQPHCANLAMIIYRVNAIDFRMRVKLIYPLTKLIIWSQNVDESYRLEHECLVPVLYNLEKGVVWQVANCLNLLKADISTISIMCNSLLDQVPSDSNPTSLLILVMQGMTSLPVSSQLNLALETLKNSNRIQAKVDRFSILLSCLNSLVVLSKILLQNNEQSAIYQLFSQTWFVEMWMNSKPSAFREEVLCCLVEACLDRCESSEKWLIVALEVIDICFKVIDWPCNENDTVGYTYFFLLFEEVCVAAKDSVLLDRVQQSLENLINRLSLDSDSVQNQYALHFSILICSKYWLPLNENSLIKFMDLLRIKLFSIEHLSTAPDISKQCLQFLLCSSYHLAKRFSTQSFDTMYRNLEDLLEVYEQGGKETTQITKIIEVLQIYAQSSGLIESEYQGYYSMQIERIPIVYGEETENFYDSMHAALNIFNRKRNECFNSERPLELLRIVQPAKELNWRCLKKTEVTGICDPLRAFCTHVIYPQYSIVVFCASFYNNTKFQMQNIQIKFFCSQNLKMALKQRNFCNVAEISTGEVFEWKVRAVISSPGEISGTFWFEFNGEELPQTCSYGSLVYTVPIPDILLRDISSGKFFSKFILLWVRLSYGITVRCELVKGFEEMKVEIEKHMECIPCGKDLKVGFQGVTLQGDRIALFVTGSIGSKNVRIEYKTNSLDLLKNFTNQTEVLLI